jgi:hypothetical protein
VPPNRLVGECDIHRVDGFTPVFVSHHQFQIGAGGGPGDGLDLYTVGDKPAPGNRRAAADRADRPAHR